MKQITWNEFEAVELRTGTITDVQDFPEARVSAYKITADFGGGIGVKKSSAQITEIYSKEELMGKKIVGVVNFPPKQIGPFISEFLVTGFYTDKGVVLAVPDKDVENGLKLA
ncbi:tRNA-binding protein [Patescibacteria group bacterium]|nr:tRNA-binding protein [Patescibacteria group bacterium]